MMSKVFKWRDYMPYVIANTTTYKHTERLDTCLRTSYISLIHCKVQKLRLKILTESLIFWVDLL